MATLLRYDPLRDVATLNTEMDRLFRHTLGGRADAGPVQGFSPALDVEEDEDAYTLHLELPGVDPDEVDVSLEESVLTISGERRFYDDRETDGFRRRERRFGSFHRSLRLPDRVAADQVEAGYHNGMLTITVPKAEEAKPRRIAINAA